MSIKHKFSKNYKLNKNILLLKNISTDFNTTTKILNSNYLNHSKLSTNINTNTNFKNNNNNNYIYDKKIFQNTKLYNVIKPTKKNIKKRNYSNSLNHNNLIVSSLTDGNINNNYPKKYYSIFNSHTLKISRNLNPHKNKNLENKTSINTILKNSNSLKLLKKSKSNYSNLRQPLYKDFIINSQDKNSNNVNRKIISNVAQINNNNLKIKNINNNNSINKKIINQNPSNNNTSTNNKLSDSIPKRSGDNDKEKIKGLRKEIETYKKDINNKEDIIKKQMIKINELTNNFENNQNTLKNTQKKYDDLKQECQTIKNNYLLLKGKIDEYEKKINIMKNKEIKLFQVLYLIKERGIDINSILNEVNQITFHEPSSSFTQSNITKKINEVNDSNHIIDNIENSEKNNKDNINKNNNIIDNINNDSRESDLTVYFPDKIKMNNIMETKKGQNIPQLNFGYVPEYSSDSDSQQNNNNGIYNNTLMEDENLYFPKFNKFQNSA